jgi:hypothetical protein
VLVLGADSAEGRAALIGVERARAGCGSNDAGEVQRWRIEHPVRAGDVLVLFESGTYYLSDGALRYRLGREGRQPLTAEWLDDRRSRFHKVDARVDVRIASVLRRPLTDRAELQIPVFLRNGQP